MDLPSLWATGESIVAQNRHAHRNTVAGLCPAWWPARLVNSSSRCCHGTDNWTDRQQDGQCENIMLLLQAIGHKTCKEWSIAAVHQAYYFSFMQNMEWLISIIDYCIKIMPGDTLNALTEAFNRKYRSRSRSTWKRAVSHTGRLNMYGRVTRVICRLCRFKYMLKFLFSQATNVF